MSAVLRRSRALWVALACACLFATSRLYAGAPEKEETPEQSESGEQEHGAPEPINWWHGLLGVKEGHPPDLLYRAPGEPAPFLASLINFGVLVFIVVKFGKKPLTESLVRRKESITREIEEAQRFRHEAEKRLAEYEARLAKIGEELERVRREFREQGEKDKQRIVGEARERQERMLKDAQLLLSQESKQMEADLLAEVVNEATRQATELLSRRLTLGDHDRFAEAFLAQLRSSRTPRAGAPAPPVPAMAKGSDS
jgi:F-type H+-transporting ATPase subunit b